MPVDEARIEALGELFPEGDLVAEIGDQARVAQRLDLLRTLAAPDLEVEMIGPGGFSGSWRGVEGFAEAWRDWLEPFASYRIEEPEIRLAGDAAVFLAHQVGLPRGGEHPIEQDAAMVAFFDGTGRLRRLEFHLDRAAALRAAGLDG
jgi:hypothetical protein